MLIISQRIDNYWIVTNNYNNVKMLDDQNCKKKYSTLPDIIFNINKNWKRLKLNWYIYYCDYN